MGQNWSILKFHKILTRHLSRCFKIYFGQFDAIPTAVKITTKLQTYIYINLPGQFSNNAAKSKVELKIKNRLSIEVTYEVLKMNFEKCCKKYPGKLPYDRCKFDAFEDTMQANCTVPYMNSKLPICTNKSTINPVKKLKSCMTELKNIETWATMPVFQEPIGQERRGIINNKVNFIYLLEIACRWQGIHSVSF